MKSKSADRLTKGDVIAVEDFPTWGVVVNTVKVFEEDHPWFGNATHVRVVGTLIRDDGKTFENILEYILPHMVTLK